MKQVEHAQTAITQEQDDMIHSEQVGFTSTKRGKIFQQMLNAICETQKDLASSNPDEDREGKQDDENHTELG